MFNPRLMRKRQALVVWVLMGFMAPVLASLQAENQIPENPNAMEQCLAHVRVDAARLREAPSLDAAISGVRLYDQPLYVARLQGKWAQVILEEGDTAYIAAYLLAFNWQNMLEQWKKGSPPAPTVGKKAKVKWAKANFRKYPSVTSPLLGYLQNQDRVAVLLDMKNGWSLVQAADGATGFMATSALAKNNEVVCQLPARLRAKVELSYAQAGYAHLKRPKESTEILEPIIESPAQYLARTAWTPEVFAAQFHSLNQLPQGQRIASLN